MEHSILFFIQVDVLVKLTVKFSFAELKALENKNYHETITLEDPECFHVPKENNSQH